MSCVHESTPMTQSINNANVTSAHAPGAAEAAAEILSGHPYYRVLRRVLNTADLALPVLDSDELLRTGAVIDVETTGLESTHDTVIELAIQRFKFDRLGRIVEVREPRSWLQDPGFPLDPQISKITGLTDQDLEGQTIDDDVATKLLNSVQYVFCHNAAFDRKFVEGRLPDAKGLQWACSLGGVDWRELGFEGRSQSALLMQAGWFYSAHRAQADIAALLQLLSHVCADGETVLTKVVTNADRTTVRLDLNDTGFTINDSLKLRGYRWNPWRRTWWVEVDERDVESELLWLERLGYHRTPHMTTLTARERFL